MMWGVECGLCIQGMLLYWVQVDSYLIDNLVPKFFIILDYIMVCDAYLKMSGTVIKEVDNFILLLFYRTIIVTI